MPTVLRQATIEIFTHDDKKIYLSISGELFGPYSDEDEAVASIGPSLATLD